jgi:hypothetical protein
MEICFLTVEAGDSWKKIQDLIGIDISWTYVKLWLDALHVIAEDPAL